MIFIIIGCIILTLIILIVLVKNYLVNRNTLRNFKTCNVVVAGKKEAVKT